ncbi:hypothetical protein O4J56_01200 [Nocardiopsis sp. RSe5-2]|uniref:DUF308 domain-containing protein n=1 Tax=Nocardiopsis endophytica TaxID=3018445 RepID=A0ABT4TYA9_9ACTN|nr:hypothetical protein [Nocardiopsis endophytica]MDA2809240.1 hypothetical protein [Nocardiopsis endophytica]
MHVNDASTPGGAAGGAAVVAHPAWLRLAPPFLGIGAGLLVKWAAQWIISLPWAPFQGPLELLESLPEPGATIGAGVLGAVGGLVLSFLIDHDALTLAVRTDRVELTRRGRTREHARADVEGAFTDGQGMTGKRLVLLGRDGRVLERMPCDLKEARVAEAFRVNGWPWLEADPYAAEYRRWVDGLPELPPAANALLRARKEALKDDAEGDDADELRRELAELGVVVREDKDRQYFRMVPAEGVDGA